MKHDTEPNYLPPADSSQPTIDSASAHDEPLDDVRARLKQIAEMEAFLQITQDRAAADKSDPSSATQVGGRITAKTDAVGQIVEGYEILSELGRGGMGVVYKARQTSLKRLVALKMLLGGRHADASQRARFHAEAEVVAKLQHPNIVQIFEIGEHEGNPFFSMEYVDGVNLAQHLSNDLLEVGKAARLVLEIAEAVHFAHQHGIIHRDLKPSNVLLQKPLSADQAETLHSRPSATTAISDLIPKISDFGLAKHLEADSKLTQSGAVIGTPSYMAPEQADGNLQAIGPRTDVYALGAILYETLTGRPPFRGASIVDTLDQVRRLDPVPPSRLQSKVPRDLEVICLKCLRKEAANRYGSAAELADDLRRFLNGEPIQARPVGVPERAWRWCRRYPAVASLLATVVLCVLGGVAGVLLFAFRASEKAREANEARIATEQASHKVRESAEQLRQGLIRENISAGNHSLKLGDRSSALWWFARAWEMDNPNPATEDTHRTRLGLMESGPQLVGACFHNRPVLDAVFDPAAKTLLTRTDESTAYQWDPFSGKLLRSLAHDGKVLTAVFDPTGDQIATGSADGNLRLWNAHTGQLVRTLPQDGAVQSIAYRTSADMLALATAKGAVRFLDPRTGQTAADPLTLRTEVYHVAFSPNGRQVLTADAGQYARVWDVASGKAVTPPMRHRDHRLQNEYAISYRCWPIFTPDGKAVVTVYPKRVATIWDLDTGKARTPNMTGGFDLHQVLISEDGARLLALAGNAGLIYQPESGRRIRSLPHPRESQHACFSPQGDLLATCSTAGLIHLWDPGNGRQLDQPLRCADGVQSLAFSFDGNLLAAASYDGVARVWRVQGATRERDYAFDCGRADRIEFAADDERLAMSPDGRYEVRKRDGTGAALRVRDGNRPDANLDHPAPVTFARFSPDGKRLLTQDRDSVVRWWDATNGKPAAKEVKLGAALYRAEISEDGSRFLSVERGPANLPAARTITVWDVESGRVLVGPVSTWNSGPQRFEVPELHNKISQAALSPDGTRLILASDASGVLGVRDVDSQGELARRDGFRGMLYGIEFSSDGKQFLTHASDTVARLWQTDSLEPAGPRLIHPGFCRRAALEPGGLRVVTVDSNDVIRLWDGSTGDLLGRIDLPLDDNSVWFTTDRRHLVVNTGKMQVIDIPVYRGALADLPALLELFTGLQRFPDDSVGPVDPMTFQRERERYKRAWRNWREVRSE